MAKKQTISFTALPNGVAPNGKLRVSVFVSPRLWTDAPAGTDVSLSEFPDWVNWPSTALTFGVTMKQGRQGVRVETLCRSVDASRLEELLLAETTTIGVRRRPVLRRSLSRDVIQITVLGHLVRVKLVRLPDGGRRGKPEFADVQRVALATGRPSQDISRLAASEAERHLDG